MVRVLLPPVCCLLPSVVLYFSDKMVYELLVPRIFVTFCYKNRYSSSEKYFGQKEQRIFSSSFSMMVTSSVLSTIVVPKAVTTFCQYFVDNMAQ